MYVNAKNLFSLGNPVNVLILLLAKQATTKNDMSEYIASLVSDDQELDKLIEKDYLKKIKGTKKLNEFQKIRLGKKGTKFLNDLDEPDVEEQDITIFNWLKNIYLKRGKTVGNGKRTQRLIASFRVKSGIELNKLSYLCKTFITDEEQQEYSHKLENVFYKPKTMFATKFVLEDSRLWQYYVKHKTMFDKEFEKLK